MLKSNTGLLFEGFNLQKRMKFSNTENVRKNNSKIENTIFSLFDWLKLSILEPLLTIDDNDIQTLKAFFRIAAKFIRIDIMNNP